MTPRRSAALLLSCVALALAGCGHSASRNDAGPPPVSSSRTSTAAAAQDAHVGIPECTSGARSTSYKNPRCGHRALTRRAHRRARAHPRLRAR